MALVVVEREFEAPQDPAALQAREDAVAWCLEERDVRFLWTFFARDRRRMVCIYDAPDAESVRYTQRKAGLPVSAIWTANSLRHYLGQDLAPQLRPGTTAVIVERRHAEAPTIEQMHQAVLQGTGCFEVNDLDPLESYLPHGGVRNLCVFGGPDAETVRRANRTLQQPFERVWSSDLIMAAP